MRFLGMENELQDLMANEENSIKALMMDTFNAGYMSCSNQVMEMYRQAESAVDQDLVSLVPSGQNLFIQLLQKAYNMKGIPSEGNAQESN
jgi:hypothetical protein